MATPTAEPLHQPLAEGSVGNIGLSGGDRPVLAAIVDERDRQRNCIELIASKNFVSPAVLEARGSILTNKYAEGYPQRRYYGGCVNGDVTEDLAIERLNQLFGSTYTNVRPHSGSQAAILALLTPGNTILSVGLDLKAGGHLAHRAAVNLSGRWFSVVSYGMDPESHLIDMDQVAELARTHRPKLLIAGGSAYPRTLDFARFRQIADDTGAVLIVDMAHLAGLVAGDAYPSPIPFADVVTSTTHEKLREPRGGFAKKSNSATFPGLQSGRLMHVIAAKAVAFGETLHPSSRTCSRAVVGYCRVLAQALTDSGLAMTTGGMESHLALVDLRPLGVTGNIAEKALEPVGITLIKNAMPNDPEKPMVTSGIRVGSAAGTSSGFGVDEYRQIAAPMLDTPRALRGGTARSRARTNWWASARPRRSLSAALLTAMIREPVRI
ncbi:serine hydroxymethyltransferase [Aquamicrobium sp.]|uniref:serine hydroxymethyltransferase n=1 Tax=Aquamicrobium sp. TaxID=1872579 RepID=UPI00338E9346